MGRVWVGVGGCACLRRCLIAPPAVRCTLPLPCGCQLDGTPEPMNYCLDVELGEEEVEDGTLSDDAAGSTCCARRVAGPSRARACAVTPPHACTRTRTHGPRA